MPYSKTSDLPEGVRNNLPAHAQEIYLAAFNSALEQYKEEERARKTAWAAVKNKYKKNPDGKWVKMSEPTFLISTEDFSTSKSLYFPYGDCIYVPGGEFTRKHGEEMVANFKSNILERSDGKLPINPEHKREMGMLGEIVDLEVGDKGVVATYDWHDETATKRFKYISPEIKFTWTHPSTGQTYSNVTLGCAATNYPKLLGQTAIFSDETQRWEEIEPSVIDIAKQFAQEFTQSIRDQIQEWRDERNNDLDVQSVPSKELGGNDKEEEMAEEEFAELLAAKEAEFAEQLKAKEAERQELADEKAKLETANAEQLAEKEAALQALSEEKAELEKAKADADARVQEFAEKAAAEERTRRLAEFSEVAKELGIPVKAENFAETLMYFNDADQSEGKAHYELMISVLKAKGNAADMAALFSEAGTDAVGDNTLSKFDALVNKRMQDFSEDISTATVAVIKEHPELYKEYDASRKNSSAGEE